jgi:hypothetical protein
MTIRRPCLWCGHAFTPRATGGSAQQFCAAACRHEFHRAARRWAEWAVAAGVLSIDELRNPLYQRTRCAQGPCPLGGHIGTPETRVPPRKRVKVVAQEARG